MSEPQPSLIERGLDLLEQVGPVVDRLIGIVAPAQQLARKRHRAVLNNLRGYEASQPSRKRRFHRNGQAGDALVRASAVELRNQARHLERNSDIASHILDKLCDFTVGNGIQVEFQPKAVGGEIHEELAQRLALHFHEWSQWPEVTWTHDRGAMERIAMRSKFRDGEVLGQMVTGFRKDLVYGSAVPVAIECMEADLLPHSYDVPSENIRQGIKRNTWGRPTAYHLYRTHPGDDTTPLSTDLKAVPADRMLHVRHVQRFHQLRGISLFATLIARLQDLHEYEDAERAAAKLAADFVLKITTGTPEMWGSADENKASDPNNPPVFKTDSGLILVQPNVGESAEFFDSKRPNAAVEPFVNSQLRRVAGGAGLSYSAVSCDYNGTYSAQRQELVENWPHYHTITGLFVAQWERPVVEEFIRWELMVYGVPAGVDITRVFDALYLGPPMPWIDPLKEAEAELLLVQAAFQSSSQVIRKRGDNINDVYRALQRERQLRQKYDITSEVDQPAAAGGAPKSFPSDPPATEPANRRLRAVK